MLNFKHFFFDKIKTYCIIYKERSDFMNLPNLIEARKRSKDKVIKELYRQNINAKGIGVGKTYHVKTYGCQMNEHDSEKIKGMLKSVGFSESDDINDADIALEMAEIARTSILMESATAMMAQSNNFPKDMLNILANLRR